MICELIVQLISEIIDVSEILIESRPVVVQRLSDLSDRYAVYWLLLIQFTEFVCELFPCSFCDRRLFSHLMTSVRHFCNIVG